MAFPGAYATQLSHDVAAVEDVAKTLKESVIPNLVKGFRQLENSPLDGRPGVIVVVVVVVFVVVVVVTIVAVVVDVHSCVV